MSAESPKEISFPEDNDAAVIHEILEIISKQRLTVLGAQHLLQKAVRATELTAFEWDSTRSIPAT